jgi:hypothetical protein
VISPSTYFISISSFHSLKNGRIRKRDFTVILAFIALVEEWDEKERGSFTTAHMATRAHQVDAEVRPISGS